MVSSGTEDTEKTFLLLKQRRKEDQEDHFKVNKIK